MMKHIYIIEDDDDILEALTFLLEKNYTVSAISDARIALNNLQSERPDVILLDLLMPDLDGAAFIEIVSQRKLEVPILVMTGYSNVDVQLNHPTVAGVIHKPFQLEEIDRKIKQVLAR